jgi:hypothetical protein
MKAPRWLASPLTGTAGVLAGLCLLAIPLRKLTSGSAVPAISNAPAVVSSAEIHAVLRLKLLAPAKRVTLKTADGKVLLDQQPVAAGESEHDAAIPFEGETAELALSADFGDATSETAVFLTVMPDGREDQTRYATGSGSIAETLRFDWKP